MGDFIFQLWESLSKLVCNRGEQLPRPLWPAPLTYSTAPIAQEHIAHLADLTELSLTLDDFAAATLIDSVAAVFPRLRVLELGHAKYFWSAQMCPTSSAILEALEQFSCLTRLRIPLNFMDRELDPDPPQRHAAHWLLEGLPNLRTVAFSWQQRWWCYGFDMVVWRKWDLRVLLRPPSPPPWPASPVPSVIEAAIPPWELDGHA
ncbi:hypothetical protein B0H19DRAFT_1076610 [Mycena capillaripes]|nr:hypothetical protein B0H19DRAFT_1076610 [Mycena capillaripes]